VSSELSRIPIRRRRQAAAWAGLFAAFLIAIGVLPLIARTTTGVRVVAGVVIAGGLVLLLLGWGLLQSTIIDERRRTEAELDAALIDVAGPAGACGCGHDHDPDELHITDACEHDGGGLDCAHNCESCVLSSLRR
jgi:hypothetical protein